MSLETPSKRQIVIARDGRQCRYCASTEGYLTIDHVEPLSAGGKHEVENMVVACFCCNTIKANFRLEDTGLVLLPAPARPMRYGLSKKRTARKKAVDNWRSGWNWGECDQ